MRPRGDTAGHAVLPAARAWVRSGAGRAAGSEHGSARHSRPWDPPPRVQWPRGAGVAAVLGREPQVCEPSGWTAGRRPAQPARLGPRAGGCWAPVPAASPGSSRRGSKTRLAADNEILAANCRRGRCPSGKAEAGWKAFKRGGGGGRGEEDPAFARNGGRP